MIEVDSEWKYRGHETGPIPESRLVRVARTDSVNTQAGVPISRVWYRRVNAVSEEMMPEPNFLNVFERR